MTEALQPASFLGSLAEWLINSIAQVSLKSTLDQRRDAKLVCPFKGRF
jgi:hypothetical protein